MKTEKYSPNWLLEKINNSNTEAQKLLYIVEFQNNVVPKTERCNRVNDNNSNRCITCGVKAGHPCGLTNPQ